MSTLADFGDNVRYLEFYHRCARPALASNFDDEFWSRIALQMAHCEPAVRHALIALGSLCETEPGGIKHARARFATGGEYKIVLTHYNKSVRALIQRMAEPTYTPEVGLVTCLLFVCIEFLRGNYHTAFTHMRNGLSIISERQQKQRFDSLSPVGSPSPPSTNGSSDRSYRALESSTVQMPQRFVERDFGVPPHPVTLRDIPRNTSGAATMIDDKLTPIFIRGVTAAIMYGVDAEENLDIPLPYPSLLTHVAFTSLHQAQQACHELRNSSALHVRNAARRLFRKEPVSVEDLQRQSNLIACHHAWYERLELFLQNHRLSGDEHIALHALKTSHYTTLIYVSCSIWVDEMEFDAHIDAFRKIIHHAEAWIEEKTKVRLQGAPHFTFEMAIISPLFFVATRCRCPATRRAAVALLARHPPREGLWDSQQHVLASNRVIEMEEEEVDPVTGWPVPNVRIFSCTINADMDVNGGFWVSFIPARLLGTTGPNGGQKLVQQFFRLDH